MTAAESLHVYVVVASVLHLGNCVLSLKEGDSGQDFAVVRDEASKKELEVAARLLGVEYSDLFHVLTTKTVQTKEGPITK